MSRLSALLVLLLLLAPQLATAGEPFAGRWFGYYKNSTGERGADSLELFESPDGHLRGTWTGSIPVFGRRVSSGALQLHGRTPARAYQINAVAKDGLMTLNYIATRLDSPGQYSGASNLHR